MTSSSSTSSVEIIERKYIVIANHFLTEINTNKFCPISQVIDIIRLNDFLKKYKVKLIDQYYLNFEVTEVLFGLNENTVDLTYEIKRQCISNSVLFIPSSFNLLNIKGDPLPMGKKKIYIRYKLSNYNFQTIFNENAGFPEKNIELNFKDRVFVNSANWRKFEHTIIFNDIISNIQFNPTLCNISKEFIGKYKGSNINVIHIKNENDCISHYANNIYRCPRNLFQVKLDVKYIHLINKYIHKDDTNIILTYDTNIDNKVIKYLKDNKYNITFITKQTDIGRELNAAIDMMIGESCNNIFIGPCYGSTFSELLEMRMKHNKMTVKFDLDHINEDEVIIRK